MINSPTYDSKEIDENPIWELAFIISEILNDNAPLGWGQYIPLAESIIANGYSRRTDEVG